jgi:predicted peroxiredoxin
MAKLLINCSYGNEDPERATLPLIVANVAVTADQEVVLFLTIEGVRIATKGYADDIQKEGFKPLKEILDSYIANGGEIWACAACTTPRGITDADLIDGASIKTAANLVEYMAGGAVTLS